ncbi:class I SAM-dependent methyltransferase [Virgibacillus siamensis]|uniref:class I SAM-dependent methyltransferase n=1 Tax=Virgibacillus siamensis TaxID=480071 RepID=UPI000984EA27|nr:class I SAM-dependent methyltransferase [Virgibacillus siamensis]
MKQNKYDDVRFFSAYERMPRSIDGLEGAGEWPVLKSLLPEFRKKQVLDLGCGFGWHCRYAREQQASSVTGVDISEKMLERAREKTRDPEVHYIHSSIEDIRFDAATFDIVISSLAFHYIQSFKGIADKVYGLLKPGGDFVFSVEHPIFTSRNEQDWCYDQQGDRLHWPVDHYQSEGIRHTSFLSENVLKYHRTFSSYVNALISAGFGIKSIKEPAPTEEMLRTNPNMKDEDRRPMFLIIAANK